MNTCSGKLFWDIESDDLLTNTEGLDWDRIAEKVSVLSFADFPTPDRCEGVRCLSNSSHGEGMRDKVAR